MNIKVSVIIPTYNRPSLLKAAVISVLDQSVSIHEIIIIDDHSDIDQKPVVIQSLSSKIVLIENKGKKGPSGCRNTGIEHSTGTHLIFLDDDDLLHPEMVERSLRSLGKNTSDATSCRYEVTSDNAFFSKKKLEQYNWQQKGDLSHYPFEKTPDAHLFYYHPVIHSFLINKSKIGSVRFDETLTYGEDYLFWLTLINQGVRFSKSNFVGVKYRMHTSNNSFQANLEAKLSAFKLMRPLLTSDAAINIWQIKMAYLQRGSIKGIVAFVKCMKSPRLSMRHLYHFVKIR